MNLLFRADANVAIGTGHVMRCIALAQALQDGGGRAVFAMAEPTQGIRQKLAAESCEVNSVSSVAGSESDSRQTIALAKDQRADWIVVDGYQFNAEYQRSLKNAGFKVLFLDDYGHAAPYSADLVLNQNAQANEDIYRARESYTRLLLGCKYCLLRREFTPWRGWKREVAPVGRKLLVSMGGSDPDNLTGVVIDALHDVPDIDATVVVGNSNPHLEELERTASQVGGWLRLRNSVNNMPELMAWADVAVSGAGSTTWEMCLLQLPMALIDIADNQTPIANALVASGAAIHLGDFRNVRAKEIAKRVTSLLASETERVTLSAQSGKLVDGWGTGRVLSELTGS